ncbi:MAG: putative porin [Prevotellaceae bacterium]|nr:putative porin [Prevotellaceae bacterium]
MIATAVVAAAQPPGAAEQDSVQLLRDSLTYSRDSLASPRDSLQLSRDSLTLADTAAIFPVDSSLPPKKKKRRLELTKMVDSGEVQIDTTRKSRILRYAINHATNEVRRLGLDTSLFYFRTDYPFLRDDVGAIFLGTLGSPTMPYSYAKREGKSEFLFMQPYEAYFFMPDNISFYNTTTPYTVLYYDWAGSKSQMEDQLRAMHAQSITHNLNIGLVYHGMGTKGVYSRQRIDNRSVSFSASYLGNIYKANFGYIFNEAEAQESGGIANDRLITDTIIEPQSHLPRLQTGKNHLRNHTFFLTHSVDIPMIYIGNDSVISNILMGRIGHSLEHSSFSKIYTDNNEAAYYANRFLGAVTRDSLGLRNFENRIFAQLRPLRAYIFESLSAGLGYKSMQAFMFYPSMYFSGTSSEDFHTIYAYASMSAWYKKYFRWNAYGQTNIAGYQRNAFELKGDMTLSVYPIKDGLHLQLGALLAGREQDIFISRYFTNHYSWSNNFDQSNELRVEAKLHIPAIFCEVGVSQSIRNNFIYFDTTAHPKQYANALSISALTLGQKLEFKGINIHHRVLVQLSSNEQILSVPLFAVSAAYYYERDLVKNVLRVQLGVDWQYCTPFNGYEYNPSVGMFHTSPVQQGGYLWADAFVAFRWKRATPFIKWEHASQDLLEGNTRYFSAVHYPRNVRVFKFGLSWKFFD